MFFPNKASKDDFTKMLKLYQHLIKHHNISGAIKYMKNIRLITTRYIVGNPLLTNNLGISTIDGWPKKLSHLKERIDNNEGISYVLTLLIFNRSLDLNKYEMKKKLRNLDYSSITNPQTSNYTIPTGFIKKFVKDYNLTISEESMKFTLKDIYLSVKGGPQGKASNTALCDFNNYNYYLLQNLYNLTSLEGIEYLSKSFTYWFNNSSNFKPKHNNLGKISIIKDPEGKIRIIAIVDYYTQLFLKKLHHNCFKLIKNNFNNCDRTFTQDPYHKWKDDENQFWSLDLSSATDRFPRLLQMRLLSHMYNMKFASSWEKHLGDISFETLDGNSIKYKVGQPMGTYSSWICFTLAHHLVVHYAAKLSGIDKFDQYIILGDDIVIKNDSVAKNYIKIINKLGVDISPTKTHVSKDTYEFAKRWIKQGKEVTGIPVRGIVHNFNNIFTVYNILYDHYKIKKNQYLSRYSLVESLCGIYKGLYLIKGKKKYFPIRNLSRIYTRLITFSNILNISFGYANDQSIREIFTRNITNDYFMIPNRENSLLEIKKILSLGLEELLSTNIRKVSLWQYDIINYYNVTDRSQLIYQPTFVGLYNYIYNLKSRAKEWIGSEEISELSHDLNIIDIDHIYSPKSRNKYSTLMTIGKSLEEGFKCINETDEIYYGSATVESSISPIGMQLSFANDIDFDEMQPIIDGTWEPPKPQMSYTQMWEALANSEDHKT
jgi:hypothetical protein